MVTEQIQRLGAQVVPGGVQFGVWSTKATSIHVLIEGREPVELEALGDGQFVTTVPDIGAGARYQFRIDGGPPLPDPRSRFQPEGVHGPSQVVDPGVFQWSDGDWTGLTSNGLVIYELHVGTFTTEGTYRAVIDRLQDLVYLGVDAIELMPIADFPGRWNWGYDGVALFAPARCYGTPGDLNALIDAAHAAGLGVLLDVVYNHFGPDGNYLREYSSEYFTHAHTTPWGDAVNYDGPGSANVREFVIDNARQWIRDYHFDGLRLDATEQIVDSSDRFILGEMQEAVRSATDRSTVIFAEEARNLVEVVHPVEQRGWGLDGSWADDFHHAIMVLLLSIRDHYYADYEGTLEEIGRAITEGFVYQGEHSAFQDKMRGTRVSDEPASSFVFCLQNHDQVGNQPFGERLHHEIDRDRYATASALLLTLPQTLLLFMGQEFMATTPFLFFTDHIAELGKLVTEGRRHEFAGLRAFAREELVDSIPDPQAESTYRGSQLRDSDREVGAGMLALYRDLLRLRREDPVLANGDRAHLDANVIGAEVLSVRRWTDEGERLLIANFGREMEVAVPEAAKVLFSTTSKEYGGTGYAPVVNGNTATIPARSATLLSIASAA
jgi:maltooligosyltrehalose trehalohydrolase